jgi:hypothetical protein
MSKKVILYIIGAVLIIHGCSLKRTSDELNAESLKDVYSKKVDQFEFRLVPFKTEKLFEVNYKDQESLRQNEKDSILNEYSNYLCFVFEIKINGFEGDITEYGIPGENVDQTEKLNYYLFGMQKSLSLKDANGNESSCVIYYREQLNEIVKTNRFIVGFNKPSGKDVIFEYDNKLLNSDKIQINLNNHHLALN